MTIIVIAFVGWFELKRYDIDYEGAVDLITPRFVKQVIKDGRIKGKAFLIVAGNRLVYAVKRDKEFLVKYLI